MEFASLTPLDGGWSGETFVAEGAPGEQVVVRIHARRPERAEVDGALMRLVRGLVPVPEVLAVHRGDSDADLPALLITELLPGVRGDLLFPTLDDAGLATFGRQMGDLAGRLSTMPTTRAGAFVGPDLRIEPWVDLPDGLVEYADSAPLDHWDLSERRGLLAVCEGAQALLDSVTRTCVVHSDLNPKNVLVDPTSLVVTGVVDWEFAHSGHPFTDLGNVLRFERTAPYVRAVLEAFEARVGIAAKPAFELCRAADLWALIELASRRLENPVAQQADERLRALVRGLGDDSTPPPGRA